jgi:transcriptional regulator with XRE-family HTH domain
MKRPLKFDVARNIEKLCVVRGLNSVSLSEKSGVSQTTISRLFKERDDLMDARISTLDAAAGALKVPAWKFVYPDMPLDIIQSSAIDKFFSLLISCPPDARARIIQTSLDLARLEQSKGD